MKKSEQLREESQQEDNDIKSFGILCKAFREERLEKFCEKWIERLENKGFKVIDVGNSKFKIETTSEYGNIEYYPKSNRIFIKNHNKRKNKGWYSKGLNWMNNNLLK